MELLLMVVAVILLGILLSQVRELGRVCSDEFETEVIKLPSYEPADSNKHITKQN